MEDRLIKEIIDIKDKQVRSLLCRTESPIERIFLLEFIKYLDISLLNMDLYVDKTVISGYNYILKPADEYGLRYTDIVIGLSIDFNSRFFTIETNNPLFKNKIKKVPTKRNIESMQVSSSQSVILQNLKFYPQFSVNIKGKAYSLINS